MSRSLPPAITMIVALSWSGFAAAEGVLVKSGQKIAFLGDSITEAGASHPGGYARLVIGGLRANGVDAELIPAGISGHKSNQMLERLQRDVIAKKPAWMTLSCGVNDVWHGANGIPLDAYQRNITAIVDRAQAAGIRVVILTATMIGEEPGNENNRRLAPYNAFLRQLATARKCPLADLNADMHAALRLPPVGGRRIDQQLTSDGVHMNPLGDRLMARGVLKAFGLDERQLKIADHHWLDAPDLASIGAGRSLTLRQYEKLAAVAHSRGKTVSTLVHEEFHKAIDALVGPTK